MNQTAEIALSVHNAYKVFGKKNQRSWLPWKKGNHNGNGSKNGANGKTETVAVDHLTFNVRRGEIFGVLGPNGGGKSTLIRLIATLLLPDEGDIQVFGHDVIKDPMAAQRMINRVSVEASFFKKLSPMENLHYGARLYGVSGSEIRRQVVEILDRLGIPEKNINRPMEEMSRGMQQKVAIARALLSAPILLLLDEPTTGLDPRSKRDVQAFVRELRDSHDTTIVLTTHDMVEAENLCDRIAIMDSGRIVALDTPEQLKAMAHRSNGRQPTLEDVFLDLTGKELIKETDLPS
ncbi:MAG: ABC transporter ATP-binding protein [Chloroflexota bacterium]|nr:MAG: ABC transporter ATP-binding protein [Chloroflexota bacterium]